jgi:hypothetical protein
LFGGTPKVLSRRGFVLSLFARSFVAAKVPLALREGFELPLVEDEEGVFSLGSLTET